ncbi:hypothetical protein Ancab_038807 [Ancistrocladus abbreviatus]
MGDPLVDIMWMDKVCDICGTGGYQELLTICSKCNESLEHTYCMKIFGRDATETWICEECDLPDKANSLKPVPSKLLKDTRMRTKNEIPPRNTKVKYISPEEVIGLGSAASTKDSNTRHLSNPAKYLASQLKRVSMGPPPSGQSVAPGHKRMLPVSMKHDTLFSKEKKTLSPSKEQHSCKEGAAVNLSTYRRVKLLSEIVDKKRNAVSSSSYCQAVASPGVELCKDAYPGNSVLTGRQLRDTPLKFDRYLQNHPALHPTWKGSFKIVGDAAAVEFCDGLQAHPASKVHCKVSKQGYTGLLEHLKKHDLVMRSSMGGVELLICTSKHLDGDSQRINENYFAWGFFRESISKEAALKDSTDLENIELVDMEIDMIGGVDLQKNHNVCAPRGEEILVKKQQEPSSETSMVIDMDLDVLGGRSVGRVDFNSKGQNLANSLPLLQVKSECLQESGVSPHIASMLKNELAFQHALQNSCSKFSLLAEELEVPPGFTEADRLKNKSSSVKIEEHVW